MIADKEHILLAVLGRTPQVLTETLYALCVDQKIPIQSVRIISTSEGYDEAVHHLFDPQRGKFLQLKRDYPGNCQQISFTPDDIIVARDGLLSIADIRTPRQSESFLELILRELWQYSVDDQTVLHCSLAGGRKTMSTYLALALQLIARPQDRLYHVLIDPQELEHQRDFYYPPPQSHLVELRDGQQIDASKTKINLIDIPFIRLRERIPIKQWKSPVGFRQLLEWVQSDIDQTRLPNMILDVKQRTLNIDQCEIRLQPQRFCLYWYFADRSRNRSVTVNADNYKAYFVHAQGIFAGKDLKDGLLQRFDRLDSSRGMRQKFETTVLERRELPMTWVRAAISRINTRIRQQLPQTQHISYCQVSAEGRRGEKYYGIRLPAEKIIVRE